MENSRSDGALSTYQCYQKLASEPSFMTGFSILATDVENPSPVSFTTLREALTLASSSSRRARQRRVAEGGGQIGLRLAYFPECVQIDIAGANQLAKDVDYAEHIGLALLK